MDNDSWENSLAATEIADTQMLLEWRWNNAGEEDTSELPGHGHHVTDEER